MLIEDGAGFHEPATEANASEKDPRRRVVRHPWCFRTTPERAESAKTEARGVDRTVVSRYKGSASSACQGGAALTHRRFCMSVRPMSRRLCGAARGRCAGPRPIPSPGRYPTDHVRCVGVADRRSRRGGEDVQGRLRLHGGRDQRPGRHPRRRRELPGRDQVLRRQERRRHGGEAVRQADHPGRRGLPARALLQRRHRGRGPGRGAKRPADGRRPRGEHQRLQPRVRVPVRDADPGGVLRQDDPRRGADGEGAPADPRADPRERAVPHEGIEATAEAAEELGMEVVYQAKYPTGPRHVIADLGRAGERIPTC